MYFNRLFRKQALASRQRQEPLDDRLQVTAPHEWLLVAGLGVMFLALLVYGAVGTFERGLSYGAVVVLPGERIPVTAPVSGTVVEVLAEVGDTVEPGQAIARLSLPFELQDSEARRLLGALLGGSARSDEAAADLLLSLSAPASAAGVGGSPARVDVASMTGGEIMTLGLSPGMPVRAGEPVALVRIVAQGPREAIALVPRGDAGRIAPGTPAQVYVARADRESEVYAAEVAAVSTPAIAPPDWLLDMGLSAPAGSHLVRVRLEGVADALADGSMGSLRVVLGQSSFLSLLAPGRGS